MTSTGNQSATAPATAPNANANANAHPDPQDKEKRAVRNTPAIVASALGLLTPKTPYAMVVAIAELLHAIGIHELDDAHATVAGLDPDLRFLLQSVLAGLDKRDRAEKKRRNQERRERRIANGTYFDTKTVQVRELAKHLKARNLPHDEDGLRKFIDDTFSGSDQEKMSQLSKWLAQQRKAANANAPASSEDEPHTDSDHDQPQPQPQPAPRKTANAAKTNAKKTRQPKAPRAAAKSATSSSSSSATSDDD